MCPLHHSNGLKWFSDYNKFDDVRRFSMELSSHDLIASASERTFLSP
jgi:hypothetical protein